jgi:hypothetical protein
MSVLPQITVQLVGTKPGIKLALMGFGDRQRFLIFSDAVPEILDESDTLVDRQFPK